MIVRLPRMAEFMGVGGGCSRAYMSATLLLDTGDLKVPIGNLEMGPHLVQGLVGDGVDAEFLLAFCEAEPQPAPSRMTRALAEELGHLGAAVAARQGRLVSVVGGSHLLLRRYWDGGSGSGGNVCMW